MNTKHLPLKTIIPLAILIGVYIGIAPTVWSGIGIDFQYIYLVGARALTMGLGPYVVTPSFRNPVWILYPFILLVNLPYPIAAIIFLSFTLAVYVLIALKLKANPITFAAFFLSPSVICALRTLNIDVFVLLGFILPAPIGLFFVLLKPQIGVAMALYWAIEAWHLGGWRRLLATFAPVTIALGATFLIYGNWLRLDSNAALVHSGWNFSIFPWGLPIGAVLILAGLIRRNKILAGAASPLFSPYVALYSWPVILAGFFENNVLMIGAVSSMWILVLLRAYLLS